MVSARLRIVGSLACGEIVLAMNPPRLYPTQLTFNLLISVLTELRTHWQVLGPARLSIRRECFRTGRWPVAGCSI